MLVDYAFPPHPSVAALLAAGATGVSRYLSYRTTSAKPKVITPAEYTALRAAGLAVVFNWEYDAQDLVNSGFDAAAAGREALSQLQAIEPDFRVLYVSADFDVTAGQWPTIRDRLRAFAGVIGGQRVGLYAPYDALGWARRDGVASWFWQAGMSTGWSGGRNRNLWSGAHLRQRRTTLIGGADCDINDIIQPDYGQHLGGDVALKDDPDGQWLFPRIEAIALRQAPGEGPEKGQNLPVLQWMADVQTNAAKAAASAGAPAPVAMTDVDRQMIIDGVSAQVGAKVDHLIALLTAAGQALSKE